MMIDIPISGLKIGLYPIEKRPSAEQEFFDGGYSPHKLNQNISHSACILALCQHTSKAVGIDLEMAPAPTGYMAVAQAFFWPEEIAFLNGVDDQQEQAGFFLAMWTAKEAQCKLLRSGIYEELPGPNLIAWLLGGCPSQYQYSHKKNKTTLLFKSGVLGDSLFYWSVCL